jgi:hypothetical protein
MTRNLAAVEKAEAFPEQPMWLTDESSPWGSDVYLAVDRAVPDTALVRLSGTFMTRVFEGPYRNLGRWIDEMKRHVAGKRRRLVHLYFFYATCPKCARRLGVNQVVLFAQVEDAAAKAA